jgi:hypothetical protein
MKISNSDSIVHINFSDGHRLSYLNFLSSVLNLNRSIGSTRNIATLQKLISAKILLIASLDDDVFGFVIIALFRSLFRRNTVALFIRPQSCFSNSIKSKLKYFIFCNLSKIKSVRIFTILPYVVRNEYRKVSSDWVHDPQMWDVFDTRRTESTSLSELILDNAKNRKIISFLGRVSRDKGAATLVNLINGHENIGNSCYFVIAGKFDCEFIKIFESIKAENISLINRHLSEEEISSLYHISSLIWCCYDNSYDQASGIFGRAAQHGKIAIVRKGSTIEKLANYYNIPAIIIDAENLDDAAIAIDSMRSHIDKYQNLGLFVKWRDDFVRKVSTSL